MMDWHHSKAGVYWMATIKGCYATRRNDRGDWAACWEPSRGRPVEISTERTAREAKAVCLDHFWKDTLFERRDRTQHAQKA